MATPDIPTSLKEGLIRYRDHRIETGGFLRSCLENDLIGALGKADFDNRYRLFEIMGWVVNEMPRECYGSPEAVKTWLREEGTVFLDQ